MSSFVTDVLLSSGQLDKRDYKGEIEEFNNKINQAKREVELFIEKHHVDFVPLREETAHLATVSTKLLNDFNSFKEKIDKELKLELQFSTHEMQTLDQQMKVSEAQLEILSDVVEMQGIISGLRDVTSSSEMVSLASQLMKANQIMARAESSLEYRLEVWISIKEKLTQHESYLLQYLKNAWKDEIVWDITSEKSTLTITQTDKLKDLCKALSTVEILPNFLQHFSNTLLQEILLPVTRPLASVRVDVIGETAHLEVTRAETSVSKLKQVLIILANYKTLFEFLEKYFGFEISLDKTLFGLIGSYIGSNFVKDFIKNCLKPALPSNNNELEKESLDEVLGLVSLLGTRLHDVRFLDETDVSLKDFVTNIDAYIVNKRCQESLTKSRDVMRQPLHETVVIGEVDLSDSCTLEASRLQDLWETMNESNIQLKQSPFVFPQCQISSTTKHIQNIVESLLQESVTQSSSFETSARLMSTARCICELYISVVPEFHCKDIEELPFHAALVHNNFMYLAHQLITIGCRFTDAREVKHHITFADIVNEMRLLGANLFLKHLRIQRDRLIAMIQDGGFNCLAGEPRLPESSEKAVNQALLHLGSLQKVWSSVLPDEVLFKAVGTLANSVLQELLGRVTTLEDIPAEAALQLVSFCQSILQRLPSLFKSARQNDSDPEILAHRYVPNWNKFKELEQLLGASLKGIEDRWASGKGPLAAYFTAAEVKQLVRALFQNTDLRAAVLSRIR